MSLSPHSSRQGMRREYEGLQAAKGAQEDEARAAKERMSIGVRRLGGCVPCAG